MQCGEISVGQVECAAQTLHFAEVRCEHAAGRKEREQLIVGGQEIERIGVEDQRRRLPLGVEFEELFQQGTEGEGRLTVGA